MVFEEPPELFPSNKLAVKVWEYVYDQISVFGENVSIRIEAIIAVMKFLHIPEWRARDIVIKIRHIVKHNVKIRKPNSLKKRKK